jgi:hypothetical protein
VVVDSREYWQERIASANEGQSKLLYEVLADDDHAWGCCALVMPGGPTDLCGAVTFFRAKGGQYKGQELCIPHATELGDKCDVEECPYESNYLHKDVPWDYDCNAPAVDPEGYSMCYKHAHEDLGEEPEPYE